MEDKVKEQPKLSSQQLRKIKKPMIERRRRERINDSLNQLKALVLDAMNKEESRYSKMEKADILEMTVKHLKVAQRQTGLGSGMSSGLSSGLGRPVVEQELTGKYRTGYAECAQEVERYLAQFEEMSPEVRMRLMGHLSGCVEMKVTHGQLLKPREEMTPLATQLSSLPGSQHPHSPSQGARVPSVSPVLPLSPASVPPVTVMTSQAPMIVVSPSGNQGGMLKDAIPLYFAGSPGRTILGDSRESPSPSQRAERLHHHLQQQQQHEEERQHRRHCALEIITDDECLLKRNSGYPLLPRLVECKPMDSSPWRPW